MATSDGTPNNFIGIPWSWYKTEKWRLHSFAKYPLGAAKSALLLAENGFVYVGAIGDSDDHVICFFCGSSKRGWIEEDSIEETHRNLNPGCPIVTGAGCDNLPIGNPINDCANEAIQSHSAHMSKPGRGWPQHGAQAQEANTPSERNQLRTPVQMASVTVMPPTTRARRHGSLDTNQSQSSTNTVLPTQPIDGDVPSSISTSRDTGTVNNYYRTPERTSIVNTSTSTPGNNTSTQSSLQSNTYPTSGINSSSASPPSNRNPPIHPMRSSDSTQSYSPHLHANPTNASNSLGNQENPPANQSNSSNSPGNPEIPPANQPHTSNSPGNPENPSANQPHTSNSPGSPENPPADRPNPTYSQLGIITERPKRFEYALRLRRLDTFADWPVGHRLKKEELADAGFYYAGYNDCVRCFFCGGGLRNWEREDDIWVEHARWFPKCGFIRQRVGQDFISVVADFAKDFEKITFKMVIDKLETGPAAFQIENKESALKNDPAVEILKEMGYREQDIIESVTLLKEISQMLSADELYDTLVDRGSLRGAALNPVFESVGTSSDKQRDEEVINRVKQSNNDLRLLCTCKVCMDKEVAIVFLPCGHMVCCLECSTAMRDCPICRKQVKGFVRGFIG